MLKMGDTPRTEIAFKESIQWDFPADYMRGKMEELERELAAMTDEYRSERIKYRDLAWKADAQLEVLYGLRKEINTELGLTDETGDDALRKGLGTIKAIKAEINGIKEKFVKCVNAHDALVNALMQYRTNYAMHDSEFAQNGFDTWVEIQATADKALLLAGIEVPK